MRKIAIYIILPIIGILVGLYIARTSIFDLKNETRESAQVVLNQIRQVTKLVTVEGSFSEIYTFENYWGVDIEGFQKKALVRINADVLVGYDLENMELIVDDMSHEIIVKNVPQPKIISIEKDLEYYDLSEGVFNKFNEKDFTNIDKRVEGYIRGVVDDSDLYKLAEDQFRSILQSMSIIASQSGYTIVWQHDDGQNDLLN